MKAQGSRALLVPVKNLANAKTRLDSLLSLSERRELAWVMLEGVLAQIAGLDTTWERVMVTNYDPAIELARDLGFRVIQEAEQVSESHSVDFASGVLAGEGLSGVLRIPLDLPLLTQDALATVLEATAIETPSNEIPVVEQAGGAPSAILVPSRDGTGTNAVYRSPPALFPSRFGPDSLSLHRSEARQAGCEPLILSSGAMGLDIDDPGDIAELVARGIKGPTLDS
ncbi:MAG: 2-phospho-L-lactate guanylyltransferase, partial [SAR324 cluster bacterium]|nr:2-phospho-L-lactate guanylyltransferase [SAR324 cluster bacterium]